MGPEIIGVMIPIFGMSLGGLGIWTKHQRRMAEMRLMAGSAENGQAAAHVRELEERVRVLERIVTDKGQDVAAQIEALRDAPRIEARAQERAQ
jgi:hypothetical protein